MALIHVDFFSNVLGMSSQMTVILPQAHQGQIGIDNKVRGDTCPVLYLLHGMTDDHTTWTRSTSLERYATERGIAVVMPNAHLSWYTDMRTGYDYYTYISREIPALCERYFPGLSRERAGRFIAGNSMGGYGAMKIALLNPDRFAGVAGLSGGMDVYDTVIHAEKDDFNPTLWEDIFGPAEQIPGGPDDLFTIASKQVRSHVQLPKIYLWCGTEDFLYEQNQRMKRHLTDLQTDLRYEESAGDHSWKCWDRKIVDVLDWMNAVMKEEA